MQLSFRCCSLMALWLTAGTLAHSAESVAPKTHRATPVAAPVARAELARGAAAIAAITDKKYPYDTTYRLIRACLEKNVQMHRDSDPFLVGAHLAIASWIEDLPPDLSWRERALARHRDVAEWLRPRISLRSEEVAHVITQAARLTPAAQDRLLRFLRRATD